MYEFTARSRSRRAPTLSGKIGGSLFFLFFFGIGSVFCLLVTREVAAGLQTRSWKPVDCEVVSSHVADNMSRGRRSGDFHVEIQYHYRFDGREFTSQQVQRNRQSFTGYRDASRTADQFPAGSHAVCYVNPENPASAILVQDNLLFALLILFPLVFMFIGAGGIYFMWKPAPLIPLAIQKPVVSPPPKGQLVGLVVCALFILAGGGLCYLFFLNPMIRMQQAKRWTEVPCEVIDSRVDRHHGGKGGSTYSVNIFYRYQIAGREHKSNRYNFMTGSSSGFSEKQAIVHQYPPGAKTVCYVNPADPTDAVLSRGFSPDMWFGLIPLLFFGLGASGMVGVIRKNKKSLLAKT